jgi:DsbC/DsbD-like thiol-disulfide interchange protein
VISHSAPDAYLGAMMMRPFLAPLLALTALPALAEVPTQADILQAELRPGWREADGRHFAALHLRLAPHWKTYWRSPGDAGVPPVFDWAGSSNLGSVKVHWPRPEVFDFLGMQTIGYRDEVVLPVEITPADPSRPVSLRADMELGVCNDICMPATLELGADLTGPGAPDGLITAALAAQPRPATEAGLTALHCEFTPTGDGLRVTARLHLPAATSPETVVMEPGGSLWVSDTEVRREGNELIAVAEMEPPRGTPLSFDPAKLRLTVLSATEALEVTGCPVE